MALVELVKVPNKVFGTVADMLQSRPSLVEGDLVDTRGYWTVGDGGGAHYEIVTGAPLQDFSDAGSIVITSGMFARLIQQTEYNLKQFGMRVGSEYASANDTYLKQACTRSQFHFCQLWISDAFHITKPLVMGTPFNLNGSSRGSANTWDPKLIKVGNSTSGEAAQAYPNETATVPLDFDAAIIIKRSSAAQYTTRGVVLKGFKLESTDRSSIGIYAPHIADFDIDVGIAGFNNPVRGHVHFLGKMAGRWVGLGTNSTDATLSIGYWLSPFGTVNDTGNSVEVRTAFNNLNKGIQCQYFGNLVLSRCTFEQIKRVASGAPAPVCVNLLSDVTATGEISVESCNACMVRVSSNANADIKVSATFHVEQDSSAEGLVRVLSGGRLNLISSTVLGNLANQVINQDAGAFLNLSGWFRSSNVNLNIADKYRYRNSSLTAFSTTNTDSTSYPSGVGVTFTGLNGAAAASLVSGVITFNQPMLAQVTVAARSLTGGSIEFGVNAAYSETVTQSPSSLERTAVFPVNAGDTLNLRAVGAVTLGSSGGVRVYITPLSA